MNAANGERGDRGDEEVDDEDEDVMNASLNLACFPPLPRPHCFIELPLKNWS